MAIFTQGTFGVNLVFLKNINLLHCTLLKIVCPFTLKYNYVLRAYMKKNCINFECMYFVTLIANGAKMLHSYGKHNYK